MKLKYFLVPLLASLIISCSKEDDPDDQADGKLWFRGYSQSEKLFYVGGEQRDASSLDLSTLFNETRRSWISTSRYVGDHYFFDDDTLEIRFDNPPFNRYGYYFSNDSLFGLINDSFIGGDPFPRYLASGSKNELKTKHCLTYIRTYRDDGTSRKGSSFNVTDHETVESVIGNSEFMGINQMGPNDTLLLINQTKIYN
ncbi:hypothetical protein O3Q51_17250 [Cryomorphaceae bacterium 1068]|nr:hypothetical protein [Cryomorphaceae bacterium 1068]